LSILNPLLQLEIEMLIVESLQRVRWSVLGYRKSQLELVAQEALERSQALQPINYNYPPVGSFRHIEHWKRNSHYARLDQP